jgi:hypothetical protein
MAGVSVTETWDTRVTSTMRSWLQQKPVDQVFTDNLMLLLLLRTESPQNKGAWGIKNKRVMRVTGGRKIAFPVGFGESTNTTSFTNLDNLSLNVDNGDTMAEAPWAYYTDAVVVGWQEAMENRGEAALFSIMDTRMERSMNSLRKRLNTDIMGLGDGVSVGNGGKNIIGVQFLLPATTTNTVWGLSRSTYTWWKPVATAAGDTFANVGVAKLAAHHISVSGANGNNPPTLWLTTSAQWAAYHALVGGKQYIISTKVGDMGFPTLQFMGVPVAYDSLMTASTWLSLNLNNMFCVLQTGADFAVKDYGSGSGNQMIEKIWRVVWSGQLGFDDYRNQGRLTYTG